MKKIRVGTICTLGILTSIILFLITCHFQIRDGYARDAGIYVSDIISSSLWILLGLCIIFIVLFFNLPRFSNRKITRLIALISLLFLVIMGVGIYISWQISFERLKNKTVEHENIQLITLQELEKVIKESDYQVVYIGRNDCPLCEYIMPKLTSYLELNHLKILYYNTQQDRENNKENMYKILDSIPVQGVPFIMIIEHGVISARFTGENILDELSEYINAHKVITPISNGGNNFSKA